MVIISLDLGRHLKKDCPVQILETDQVWTLELLLQQVASELTMEAEKAMGRGGYCIECFVLFRLVLFCFVQFCLVIFHFNDGGGGAMGRDSIFRSYLKPRSIIIFCT
jgi:hypothetical protein